MSVLNNVVISFLVLLCSYVGKVFCDCTLSLDKDFGHPSPVYIQHGRLLQPSASGDVVVKRASAVTVACPGDKRFVVTGNYTTNFGWVKAQCVSNTTFKVGPWSGPFKELSCNGPPWFVSEDIGECFGGNRLYRVGYKIDNMPGSKFFTLYTLCFNQDLVHTLYVQHELSPRAKFIQTGGNRPSFIEGGLFGKVKMSKLYNIKNQRERLNAILGEGMDQVYISKNQFLTRGHLAPRADFPMRAEQRATFHYANTAPQWMRNNAGDWAALEEALRRRTVALNSTVCVLTGAGAVLTLPDSSGVSSRLHLAQDQNNNGLVPALRRRTVALNSTVCVLTGAGAVLTLPDTSGVSSRLHLAQDQNNNGLVPVPMYFFKLVHSPRHKTATAFVTINSSFYNETVNDRLTFCQDVCDGNNNFSWLRWRADGAKSFCCSYEDFIREIGYLPKVDASNGLFY